MNYESHSFALSHHGIPISNANHYRETGGAPNIGLPGSGNGRLVNFSEFESHKGKIAQRAVESRRIVARLVSVPHTSLSPL